jgi:DHA1 family tetracycline resistance protein-like MFS transporter
MKKPSLLIIFLTVFIDLIGFGIVIPFLPLFVKNLGANGFFIGLIMAIYSAMQFIFAPVWGRLSDRVGRRPILLVSTAAAAVSYVIFALGAGMTGQAALIVLFGSRILAGICGANITVAQAYIADVTPPDQRSKKMGLVGMAFGLGFILGPALSGISMKHWGNSAPGWLAAGLCAANFVFAFFMLPESWKPEGEQAAQRPRFAQWMHVMNQPKVGLLISLFFLATFCFTCFETTLGLLVSETFHLDVTAHGSGEGKDGAIVGYLFAYCGIIGALVQGGAIGRAVKKLGEPKLIAWSLVFVAIGLAPMPFLHSWAGFLVALAVLAIGSSLTRPPIFGMISNLTVATEQGATIGVAQSAGSLARIVGPLFAGTLFTHHHSLPYLIAGGISLATAFFAWRFLNAPQPVT